MISVVSGHETRSPEAARLRRVGSVIFGAMTRLEFATVLTGDLRPALLYIDSRVECLQRNPDTLGDYCQGYA